MFSTSAVDSQVQLLDMLRTVLQNDSVQQQFIIYEANWIILPFLAEFNRVKKHNAFYLLIFLVHLNDDSRVNRYPRGAMIRNVNMYLIV